MGTSAAAAAGAQATTDWKDTLGRVGLVGKGVLYSVIGLIAIQLAAGDPTTDTTTTGAVQWIASRPFGKFLLVALTVALFALAAWRLLDAALGDPVEGSDASNRAKYAGKGLVYLSLASGALSITIANWTGDGASGSDSSSSTQATGTILEWPAGRWIVALIGLAVIGYGLYVFKTEAVDEDFLGRMSVGADSVVAALGRYGYAARSVVFALIGSFLLHAGLTYQPTDAGLSAALREIAGYPWGRWLLWAVAVGLLAHGLFTVTEAKYRRAA